MTGIKGKLTSGHDGSQLEGLIQFGDVIDQYSRIFLGNPASAADRQWKLFYVKVAPLIPATIDVLKQTPQQGDVCEAACVVLSSVSRKEYAKPLLQRIGGVDALMDTIRQPPSNASTATTAQSSSTQDTATGNEQTAQKVKQAALDALLNFCTDWSEESVLGQELGDAVQPGRSKHDEVNEQRLQYAVERGLLPLLCCGDDMPGVVFEAPDEAPQAEDDHRVSRTGTTAVELLRCCISSQLPATRAAVLDSAPEIISTLSSLAADSSDESHAKEAVESLGQLARRQPSLAADVADAAARQCMALLALPPSDAPRPGPSTELGSIAIAIVATNSILVADIGTLGTFLQAGLLPCLLDQQRTLLAYGGRCTTESGFDRRDYVIIEVEMEEQHILCSTKAENIAWEVLPVAAQLLGTVLWLGDGAVQQQVVESGAEALLLDCIRFMRRLKAPDVSLGPVQQALLQVRAAKAGEPVPATAEEAARRVITVPDAGAVATARQASSSAAAPEGSAAAGTSRTARRQAEKQARKQAAAAASSAAGSSSRAAAAPAAQQCTGCGATREAVGKLRACRGCKTALYCSAECQKRHWKEHKKVCAGKKEKGSG